MRRVPAEVLPLVLASVAVLVSPAPAFADSPRQFLEQALRGDNSEIMLGRIAADRARDPQVREFGRTLVQDHAEARTDVIRIGRRMGLHATRDVTDDARDLRDRLRDARGREFDRMFIRHMVDDHRHDIDAFRDEARERHGPVSDLAARQLPTLQKHLDMALALDRSNDRRADRSDWRDHDGRDSDHDGRDRDR
jgi:putative membrane protein